MNSSLHLYSARRDQFLSEVFERLPNDERVAASWLTGSFAREQADSVSDIDISVVITDNDAVDLCSRAQSLNHQVSHPRLAFISMFGDAALIHENHSNAPEGGTFTFALYANSAVMVDWIFLPRSKAMRPYESKLLFDKVGIPVRSLPTPETLEQRRSSVLERWAFFWMMTAITVKYAIRSDGVFVTLWIENLCSIETEIKRLLNGESWEYTRGSLTRLQTTREKQIELLLQLCRRMQELQPGVTNFTGTIPQLPLDEIETLLSVARDARSEI